MSKCDCGRDFKGYRGLVQHWNRGCPTAIVKLFMEGRSMRDLATKFDKPLAKIEGIIRRAVIERKGK